MAPKAAPKAAAPPPPPEQPPQQQGWPVWQPWNLFQPLGQALEQGFETGLDACVPVCSLLSPRLARLPRLSRCTPF